MFVAVVCFLFLLKLKWPKSKNPFSSPLILALVVNAVALKNINNRPAYLWCSSALMQREVLLVELHDAVPQNETVAMIGSIRERNVVRKVELIDSLY